MKFLDQIKQVLNLNPTSPRKEQPPQSIAQSKPLSKTKTPKTPKLSAKDLATQRGEPYITILSFNLDPNNLESGSFELDWNDKFVTNLVRAGYQHKPNEPENNIVDRWFQEICRNVVLEFYEQEQADPDLRRLNRKKLDDDRTEFS